MKRLFFFKKKKFKKRVWGTESLKGRERRTDRQIEKHIEKGIYTLMTDISLSFSRTFSLSRFTLSQTIFFWTLTLSLDCLFDLSLFEMPYPLQSVFYSHMQKTHSPLNFIIVFLFLLVFVFCVLCAWFWFCVLVFVDLLFTMGSVQMTFVPGLSFIFNYTQAPRNSTFSKSQRHFVIQKGYIKY